MATSCFYALAAQHKYGFRIFHPWNTFIVLPSLCPATKIRPVHSIHWRQSRVVLKQTFLHQIKMGKYIGARWQIVTLWFVWNRKHRADTPCSFTPWQPSARPACFSCVTKHEPMGPLGQSGHAQDREHFSSRAVRWQCTQYLPTATRPAAAQSPSQHLSDTHPPAQLLHLKEVFCDRKGLFTWVLLLHVVTLCTSCHISVMSQMTGTRLTKFYRGQRFIDEGAHSSGSIW